MKKVLNEEILLFKVKKDVLEQRIKQLDIKEAGIDKLEAELKDKIDSKVVEIRKSCRYVSKRS